MLVCVLCLIVYCVLFTNMTGSRILNPKTPPHHKNYCELKSRQKELVFLSRQKKQCAHLDNLTTAPPLTMCTRAADQTDLTTLTALTTDR